MSADREGRAWGHSVFLIALALAAVGVAVLAVSQLGIPSSSARTTTETVTAENGVVQTTVSGSGNVAAGVDDETNFATSGTLKRVYVREGEHVTKGQILATLDPASAQLTLAQANAELTAAQDTLADAEDGSSSSTTTTIDEDELTVDSDEETVKSDELAVADTSLRAPVTGTIVSLEDLLPGDPVQASSSSTGFAEIVNTGTLTMTVAISEADIGQIKVGQAATVTVDALAGVELAAHVAAISSDSTDTSDVVSYNVTLKLDQTDSRVLSGMSASAAIVVAQADGVTVPNAAVTGSGSEGTVTLDANGKRVEREVVVALRGTDRTEIASGLKAGDELIVTQTLPSLRSGSATTTSSTASSGTLGGTGLSGTLGGGSGFGGGAP
jgi:membrane fusion protein, macrolide-specific efflux system